MPITLTAVLEKFRMNRTSKCTKFTLTGMYGDYYKTNSITNNKIDFCIQIPYS